MYGRETHVETVNIMAKTYRIRLSYQDPYIASRSEKARILETSMPLNQAYKKLLELYNDKYEGDRPYAQNWGLAVIQSAPFISGAVRTFSDGTRMFDWDGRVYSIEEENE